MVDIHSATAEIRRGKKRRRRKKERKKPQGKNIMACPSPQGGHNINVLGRLQNELYVDKQRSSVGHAIEN